MIRHRSIGLCAGIVLLGAVGCTKQDANVDNAADSSSVPATKPTAPKAGAPKAGAPKAGPPKVIAPKPAGQKPGGQKPAALAPKMTKTQTLGVDIIKAISRDPKLKGARISVGTTNDTVSLEGTIITPGQSKQAESIARQKSPGYKLVNHLKTASATPSGKPQTKK